MAAQGRKAFCLFYSDSPTHWRRISILTQFEQHGPIGQDSELDLPSSLTSVPVHIEPSRRLPHRPGKTGLAGVAQRDPHLPPFIYWAPLQKLFSNFLLKDPLWNLPVMFCSLWPFDGTGNNALNEITNKIFFLFFPGFVLRCLFNSWLGKPTGLNSSEERHVSTIYHLPITYHL